MTAENGEMHGERSGNGRGGKCDISPVWQVREEHGDGRIYKGRWKNEPITVASSSHPYLPTPGRTRHMSMHPHASRSHNEVPLSRETLLDLLNDLQSRTLREFRTQIRLFVHGGAVMILHDALSTSSTRRTTRDIDYIRRAFGHEWRKRGVYDAEDRLQACINATAHKFHVGTDWMNADPDVALPFARDPRGHIYDPIYHDSKQQNNIDMNTIYKGPGLRLISVTMFWGVALKLVRYKKEDPTDIVAMLRHGTRLNGVKWTPKLMEEWIKTLCWPMGYNNYHPRQLEELKSRIQHAVRLVQTSPPSSSSASDDSSLYSHLSHRPSMPSLRAMSVSPVPMSFSHSAGSRDHIPVSKHIQHLSKFTVDPSPPQSRHPLQPRFTSPPVHMAMPDPTMTHHHLLPPHHHHHSAARAF
ncbi:hypothetical protein ID866_7443 [Astraeus odoratus]|nr:hypothetical protein ID866_7443 [Astraeus odoratus]